MLFLIAVLSFFAEAYGLPSTKPENMQSEESFHAIQSCMKRGGVRFEDLPTKSQIGPFIDCCVSLLSPRHRAENIPFSCHDDADGRDIISMSAADMQHLFCIDLNISSVIVSFISWRLTAHLPGRR